jgi:hypothetical protein
MRVFGGDSHPLVGGHVPPLDPVGVAFRRRPPRNLFGVA